MSNSEKMLHFLEQQDLEQADQYFQKALHQDDEEILYQLGLYLESIGFYPQAKQVYQHILEHYPEVALQLAHIANEDGETETAFAYLDRIGPDSPYWIEALVMMADFYQSEELVDVAKEKLLLALELSDEPIIRFGLAELEMELGNFKEAIALYALLDNRELLEQTGVSTYQRIGVAYASLGRFEAAVEFLEQALEIEYDDQTAYELATLLYEMDDYQKAAIYYKQLDTISPDFEGYEYAYAKALHAEHKIEEAYGILKKGLAKNPFDSLLLLLASQYAYELHDKEAAQAYLLKAKEVADDPNEVVLRLTNLYLEDERYEEVIALSSEELDNVLAKWNIAKAYQALEMEDEAVEAYQKLEMDLGQNPEFLADYIAFLREIGAYHDAQNIVRRYLELVPDDLAMQEFYDLEE